MSIKTDFARRAGVLVSLTGAALCQLVHAGETPAPANANLYIIAPSHGEVIEGPSVTVVFGLRNAGIAPAGVEKKNTGHHHLLIDAEVPPFDEEIPADQNHVHFGGGQSETVIELSPGKHTLQLLLGDYEHVPHDPPILSERITVTIK